MTSQQFMGRFHQYMRIAFSRKKDDILFSVPKLGK